MLETNEKQVRTQDVPNLSLFGHRTKQKTARCLIQLVCIGLCTKNGATRKWIDWQNTITSMIVVRSSEWVVSIHAMHDTTNVLGTHLFDKANDTTNVNYSNICLCYEKPCYESNEQWTDCQQLNQCQLINWSNNVNQPCLFYYIRQNCQMLQYHSMLHDRSKR